MISFYSLTTADGSAVAPQDYDRLVDYTVAFAISETNKCVNVTIEDDNILEHTETFTITMTTNDPFVTINETNKRAMLAIVSDDIGESGCPFVGFVLSPSVL
jgi:hypothetical protein